MFERSFIIKLKKTGIFFAAFTVIYILFFLTLPYTLPFVLAFILSLCIQPLNKYIQKKFKLSSGVSSIIITTLVFFIIGIIVLVVMYKITNEAILLIARIPSIDIMEDYARGLMDILSKFFGNLDPGVVEKIYEYSSNMTASIIDILIKVLNSILSFILSLPSVLMIAFITFLATYFFSKDITIFKEKFYSVFSLKGKGKMENIIKQAVSMMTGYIKAYSTVIMITFIETLIGFLILGIDYALILSFLAAFMDVLPIIGVSVVYIPLAIYHFLIGNTFIGIGILVLLVLVTVVRQILEPKLISTTLDIHPILTLAAIFIGIKVYGFIGMIYLITLIIFYKILEKSQVL